ncbi:MAG: DUF5615 family PIN-like protein [Gemmatimonadaceae bacterium]|nr:DUF5615 family PIN-like protein [Gemmatimonadaceae bacterium]
MTREAVGAGLRLLFDQNLAPSLAMRLRDLYPGAVHVRHIGLARADDAVIWQHARRDNLMIVTKDDDFRQLAFVRGSPPKVIWTRLGNCTTADVERLLRVRHADVMAFAENRDAAVLVLDPSR